MNRFPIRYPSLKLFLSLLFAFAALHSYARACGGDLDCQIGNRTYRIALPNTDSRPLPSGAIIFVHGYRGKAEGVMHNKALLTTATRHGAAFVAAQAAGPEWNIPGVPSADTIPGINELDYFDALISDLKNRFGIDPRKIVVSGFSSGAMMVWHLACHRGNVFAGFVPFSGTFWKPLPKSCPTGPINIIHYHGTKDPIVPMHGRPIKDGHQGDVYEAIKLIAKTGGYGSIETNKIRELDCSRRVSSQGKFLEFCLFPGKHEIRANYLDRAWREIITSTTR
jgi:polyhydroxybutyrate depolymerase